MKRRSKKSGYLFTRGNLWNVRFRVDGKDVYVPLETADEKTARAKAAELAPKFAGNTQDAIDALRGALARLENKSDASGVMLSLAWRAYESSRSRPASGERTLSDYESQFKAFVAWHGDGVMAAVDRTKTEAYVAHLESQKLSSATVNKHVTLLRLVWSVLLPEAVNPWLRLVAAYKTASVGHRAFSDDMMRRILNHNSEGEFRALLHTLAYTGLRLCDACLLRSESVFVSRGVIEVLPMKTRNRGSNPLVAKIGIHRAILSMMAARVTNGGYVFPAMAEAYQRDSTAVCRQIQRHLEECGVDTQAVNAMGRNAAIYSAHSFRHTLTTALVKAGVDVEVRQKIICHKGGMSQRYTHVSDEQVIEAIDKAMSDHINGGQMLRIA